jgi:hypothetical protein
MEDESDSQAVWETWLTPDAALKLCAERGWAWDTAARNIALHLKSGLLDSTAKVGVHASGTKRPFAPIPRDAWGSFAPLANTDFWNSGTIQFHKGSSGYYDRVAEATFFGVRFNVDQIREMLPTAIEKLETEAETEQPEKPSTKARLPENLLEEWAALFNKANPTASEAMARAAIDAMFPTRHATREQLRRVFLKKAPGRPLKNKEE